jgi:hypothetical protein
MGLFSKLFKSNPADPEKAPLKKAGASGGDPAPPAPPPVAEQDRPPAAAPLNTPLVTPAYVPPSARPTPTESFERATVVGVFEEERPTIVTPEPVAKALAKATAPARPPPPPMARPSPPKPRADARPPPPPRPGAGGARPPTREKPGDVLDKGFAGIQAAGRAPARPGTMQVDLSEVHALFGELATNHLRQLRDFIIELRWGATPTTWIAVCEPSLVSLRRAAETLEFEALVAGLTKLTSAMLVVDPSRTTTVDGEDRDRILAAHGALEQLLPQTFAIDADRSLREATILHTLLSQIPDVGKVTIDKLYAAGLTTLDTMLLARVDDLVATTGIPTVLAERLTARFREYRAEMASAAVDANRTHERAKIATFVGELRQQNEAFARAAEAWTEDAIQQKKDVLLARSQTMLAIDLQLARLGEIALVRELERLPFARKLQALEAFLAKADEKYAVTPPGGVQRARG